MRKVGSWADVFFFFLLRWDTEKEGRASQRRRGDAQWHAVASRWGGILRVPDAGCWMLDIRIAIGTPRYDVPRYSALLFLFSLSFSFPFRQRVTPPFLLGPGFVAYPFCAKW
jgi:hypothetical protein